MFSFSLPCDFRLCNCYPAIHGLLLQCFAGQKACRIKVVFRRVADKHGVVGFAAICRRFAVNELLLCEKDRQTGAAADFAVRRMQQ